MLFEKLKQLLTSQVLCNIWSSLSMHPTVGSWADRTQRKPPASVTQPRYNTADGRSWKKEWDSSRQSHAVLQNPLALKCFKSHQKWEILLDITHEWEITHQIPSKMGDSHFMDITHWWESPILKWEDMYKFIVFPIKFPLSEYNSDEEYDSTNQTHYDDDYNLWI